MTSAPKFLPQTARGGRRVWAFAVVPLGFLAVFFVYPVVAILGRGLMPDGSVDLSPLGEVARDASLRDVVWFTVWQAALSTVLTVLVALPGAYVLARIRFPGRSVVRALVTVPFVLPTVVVGSAFLSVLGAGGPLSGLDLDQSLTAILVAHVFFNYAVVVRVVGALWEHLDPRPEESARMLGASHLRAFIAVTLPALRGALAAAASIVFLFSFTSFGVILILGGPHYSTLETEIYRQTVELFDLPVAAALTIVQLLAVLALLAVSTTAQGREASGLRLQGAAETARPPRGAGARMLLATNLAVMAALLGGPLAVLVARSFATSGGPSLGFYRALGELRAGSTVFVPPVEAIRNSMVFGAVATVIAVVVGGLAAVVLVSGGRGVPARLARAFDSVLMLPLGVSAVTVGFGFLIALDEPPLDLRSRPVLIPIAHALVAMPLVIRIMVPTLRAIDPHLRESAATLGASPARVWREVDLPVVARTGLVAAGLAFAVSLGEFGATIFIARPDYPTLPVLIFRLLGQPGTVNFGAAMAASAILMALTAIVVLVFDRLRLGTVGEF
ncbi:MAG: ABC transporter permease [Acidimicrobiia bacterium]